MAKDHDASPLDSTITNRQSHMYQFPEDLFMRSVHTNTNVGISMRFGFYPILCIRRDRSMVVNTISMRRGICRNDGPWMHVWGLGWAREAEIDANTWKGALQADVMMTLFGVVGHLLPLPCTNSAVKSHHIGHFTTYYDIARSFVCLGGGFASIGPSACCGRTFIGIGPRTVAMLIHGHYKLFH